MQSPQTIKLQLVRQLTHTYRVWNSPLVLFPRGWVKGTFYSKCDRNSKFSLANSKSKLNKHFTKREEMLNVILFFFSQKTELAYLRIYSIYLPALQCVFHWMGLVRITSWYPNFNGSHFGLPPSKIHRMTGLPPKIVWTMTYSHRPHCQIKDTHTHNGEQTLVFLDLWRIKCPAKVCDSNRQSKFYSQMLPIEKNFHTQNRPLIVLFFLLLFVFTCCRSSIMKSQKNASEAINFSSTEIQPAHQTGRRSKLHVIRLPVGDCSSR